MSQVKFVSPSGWDFDRAIAMPVKWAQRGLLGEDRAEFIKTAGSAFEDQLSHIKIAADEVPVHVIALGASEFYGPNRNGDAFPVDVCRNYYPTFVKFASYFNNHKNKPEKGDPRFGIVKAAAWNEAMKRVELLLALNATKSACERNGGFVDERALEKLARGEDLPVSMACRVPYDVCSWCGNKAATRKNYCTMEKCAAGGCKHNLTRLVKVAGDLHHLHVRNVSPVWFDLSRVFRPADRIAYGSKADWLTKAAADNGLFALVDMLKMSEDATAPAEVILYQDGITGLWNIKMAAQSKLAHGLSVLEQQERGPTDIYRAFSSDIQRPFDLTVLGSVGTVKCAEGLGALSDKKIVLHLRDFARLVGQEALVKEATARLPGVYTRMIEDGSLDRRIEQNKFPISEKIASSKQLTAASVNAEEHSLEKEAVHHRSMLSVVRNLPSPGLQTGLEKNAGDGGGAEQLARDYAIYKLAALQRIATSDPIFPLTARYAVRQNHVS